MKSLKQQRKQFAVVGRELREGRTEDVREHYQWLLVRSGCKTHRNDRLRSLCSELIVHGQQPRVGSVAEDHLNPFKGGIADQQVPQLGLRVLCQELGHGITAGAT
jgi:hypothetical protein